MNREKNRLERIVVANAKEYPREIKNKKDLYDLVGLLAREIRVAEDISLQSYRDYGKLMVLTIAAIKSCALEGLIEGDFTGLEFNPKYVELFYPELYVKLKTLFPRVMVEG